jgi:transposase
MAVDLTPDCHDAFWQAIAAHLPRRPRDHNPKGGRPRADDQACLRGILYVLREGCRWQKLPSRALDCPSGSTCWRRFRAWTLAGVWTKAHVQLLDLLGEEGVLNLERIIVDSASVRAKLAGQHTGRSSVDRGKKGCKRHVLTDAEGIPLVIQTGPGNQRDDTKWEDLLEAFPVLTDGKTGEVHVQPPVLMGDRGYGFKHIIALVLLMGIVSLLSPRGKDKPHGSGLGEQRYVVERTMSWWGHFRRINFCYERKGEHFQGFHDLAACILCANKLRDARAKKRSEHPFTPTAAA